MNVYRVNGLTVRGVRLDDGGDVFHCEQCKRVLLDRVTLRGHGAQETIKINQSSDVTVQDSDISGAEDNAFDAVAVRRIKLLRSHFYDAGDWCGYVKGGSTQVIVRGNLFSECGTGGFIAGQGTGLQFLTSSPHLKAGDSYGSRFTARTCFAEGSSRCHDQSGRNTAYPTNLTDSAALASRFLPTAKAGGFLGAFDETALHSL